MVHFEVAFRLKRGDNIDEMFTNLIDTSCYILKIE